MARPRKQFKSRADQAAHEARLAKRRAKHAENATLRMALKAAKEGGEGAADFQALVEQEKLRQDRNQQQTAGRKGAATPPKVTAKARDDLAAAFEYMGGVPALVVWGRANPTEFYRIWARLIPREAAETTSALPLETLLEKLATKEELSVGQAAIEIGQEALAQAQKDAEFEDLHAPRPEELN
jgi:hypothetical protein